jgi:hypothetical protein
LHSGAKHLVGLEHHPLPQLDPETPSGTKLLVIGPVDVRNSTLLLKPENLFILGGKVEELELKNKLMRQKINEPTTGKPHQSWESGEEFLASVLESIEGGAQMLSPVSSIPPPPRGAVEGIALPVSNQHPSLSLNVSAGAGAPAPAPALAPAPGPAVSGPACQEEVVELVEEIPNHGDVIEEKENSCILICESPRLDSVPLALDGMVAHPTGKQLIDRILPPPPRCRETFSEVPNLKRVASPLSRKRKVSEGYRLELGQTSAGEDQQAIIQPSNHPGNPGYVPRLPNIVENSEIDGPVSTGAPGAPGGQDLRVGCRAVTQAGSAMGLSAFMKSVPGRGYTFMHPYTYLYSLSTFASTAAPEDFPIHAIVNGHISEIVRTQSAEDFFSQPNLPGQRRFELRGVIEDGTMRMTVQFNEQLIWKLARGTTTDAGRQTNPLNADVMYNLLTDQNSQVQRQGKWIIGTCIKKLAEHVGLIRLHTTDASTYPIVMELLPEPVHEKDMQALRQRLHLSSNSV